MTMLQADHFFNSHSEGNHRKGTVDVQLVPSDSLSSHHLCHQPLECLSCCHSDVSLFVDPKIFSRYFDLLLDSYYWIFPSRVHRSLLYFFICSFPWSYAFGCLGIKMKYFFLSNCIYCTLKNLYKNCVASSAYGSF